MVEHSAVNRRVVGSSPTRGVSGTSDGPRISNYEVRLTEGPLVKRLRHRPFTAVTGVRFPYGSLSVAMRLWDTPVPIPNTMVKL